ncbi:probable receptor-like serine/threonine-protein kinase At4g34500 [Impatiens glandulifera]|uniref:probable receptor-like serine/threonine-protein kinase At4g34500 n=1 Tax=Impatiens glandulifera TaxID=253017 RepID=UPI001FB070E6|nr:probable receptor-like serine/threonine-protein kinase At4g34500 [Impatiens glandulifera]
MLMIEIISGKYPNDFSWEIEPEGKLIDWFKSMVERQEFDHLLDPKIRKVPPLMELKKTILIALRCADADVEKRPTMEDVFRMFQPRGRLIINVRTYLFL